MPEAESGKRRSSSSAGKRKSSTENKGQANVKRRRKRRKRGFFSFLLILLILLCMALIVIKTPLFNIETISVEGNVLVSDEDIIGASGIEVGQNILSHKSSYYEELILALPYISKVDIEKKFPSDVIITVEEEYEYAAVELETRTVICDKYGKSIKIAQAAEETEKLIKVSGCKTGVFETGGYIELSDEIATETMKRCFLCISDYGFLDVTKVDISDVDNIVFTVGDSLIVKVGKLGDDDELSYKMAYIKEVVDTLPHGISGIIDATNLEAGVSYRTGDYEHTPVPEEIEVPEGTGETTLSGEEATGNTEETESVTETEAPGAGEEIAVPEAGDAQIEVVAPENEPDGQNPEEI
ncbi:MAG: FtsQ-type POTRA domain-containing protein [Clostridia bacterium]|nr:FtsQ-type POTRA domain-containing protein [Clostridia bacterium]